MEFRKSTKQFLATQVSEEKGFNESTFVVIQAPYEHTSSYKRGSANGPKAIIEASHYVEFYDEELDLEVYNLGGIHTLSAVNFEGSINREALDRIALAVQKVLEAGKYPVVLGAEHTISLPVFEELNKAHPGVSVLQFDAHADLRDSYEENRYSHACVMARINEYEPRMAQVGIRALCSEEAELIKSSENILTVFAQEAVNQTDWEDRVLKHLGDKVYITIDADAFDPAIIPGTGTPEPGGLQWYPTLRFLRRVFAEKNVVGFDIVECAPREGEIISEFTLAKLMYKLIGYRYLNQNYQL